jgi:flagellar basal-body rod modification protein FlgD
MNVSSSTSTSSAGQTQTKSAVEQNTLDYTAFLRLLIAELKNQDPTKPMDSAQYMAQLASFSNVEQAVKTNAKLDAMMSAFSLSQAESYLGRAVISADGETAGTVAAVRVTSAGAVALLDNGQELLLGPGITVA